MLFRSCVRGVCVFVMYRIKGFPNRQIDHRIKSHKRAASSNFQVLEELKEQTQNNLSRRSLRNPTAAGHPVQVEQSQLKSDVTQSADARHAPRGDPQQDPKQETS